MNKIEQFLARPKVKFGYITAVIATSCIAFYPVIKDNVYKKEKLKYDALQGLLQNNDQVDEPPKDYEMVRIGRISENDIGDYQSAVKEYEQEKYK